MRYSSGNVCMITARKHADSNGHYEIYQINQDGTKSFLGLVEYANLKSPFEDGCVSSIITDIKAWLDAVEDQQL